MATIKFFSGGDLPLEMHKVRIVQKLTLPPIGYRLKAMNEAGNNMFLLQNADVFMDMLTGSGANAVSDHQLAAMMVPDEAVPEPQAGRGPRLCRGAGNPALLLWQAKTRVRLAGKTRREVPRGLRRQPLSRTIGERPLP